MEVCFGVTFDRNIEDGDYIVPGGYGVKVNGKEIRFDFKESNMKFDEEDEKKIHFLCCGLDLDAFPKAKKLKYEDTVRAITEITECFVYTAKEDNEEEGLKVVKLDYFSFVDADIWRKTIDVPDEIIDAWNKKLAQAE